MSESVRVVSREEVLTLVEALSAYIKHGEQHEYNHKLSERERRLLKWLIITYFMDFLCR